MKKLFLFAAISISVSAFAQNPTDRGWRSVGGTGALHFDLDGDDGFNHNFLFGPEMYWFVGNSFALGADFGVGAYFNKREDSTVITRTQNIDVWVAPGFRFYMREPEKKWRPYVFANAGYQYTGVHYNLDYKSSTATDTKGKSSLNGLRAYTGAGIAWFFSDHAAFDIRMNVLDFYPGINSSGRETTQFDYSPDFKIGIQAFFD